MFLIYLFVVLLQTQGRSSPLVRLCTRLWHHTRLCTLKQNKQTVQLMLQNMTEIYSSESWELFFSVPTLWVFFRAGEVTAIVIGVMCGCVGLAVIVRFIVKTIRWARRTPPPIHHCHCLLELQSTRSHCPCRVSRQIFHSAPPWDSCGKQVVYLLPKLTQLHGQRLQRCFSDSCAPTPAPHPDRNVLEHWSKGYGSKLEPTKKGERFMTDWFVPHWFRLRQEHP